MLTEKDNQYILAQSEKLTLRAGAVWGLEWKVDRLDTVLTCSNGKCMQQYKLYCEQVTRNSGGERKTEQNRKIGD